jgi:metal-dependent HD superfamily phosphatase/phosphodiesterase
MELNLPVGENRKLATLVGRAARHNRLQTYWQCSNVIAVERMGINDHGPVHIKIVCNMALKILRLLMEQGIRTGVEENYQLTKDDAEVIVVLAGCLHDIGHIVHRHKHEAFSVALALPLLEELIEGLYGEREEAIITSETLHAIISHDTDIVPLTMEAGVLKVADSLDMEQGRARIPFSKGSLSIHAVSAMAIERVQVLRGEEKPVCIQITMSNSAGIFQLDNLLKPKLLHSGIKDYFEIRAEITGEEKKIVSRYEI